MNKLLENIGAPDSVAINDSVQKLKAEGEDIISLNVGDPNFDTPEPIRNELLSALNNGATHYTNSRGLPELRSAIADKYLNEYKIKLNPEKNILITNGAVHAYFSALKSILNPGAEVLTPNPTWMTHFNMVKFLGGNPVQVHSDRENNFLPEIKELQKAVNEKTAAVVINSPSNPTGAVAGIDYLSSLVEFAEKNNLFIISDEVYEKIVFDNIKFHSVLEIHGAEERTLLINSFSKTYAMTGWRLGFLIAPEDIINYASKSIQYTITNHQPFVQYAGIEALKNKNILGDIAAMVEEYSFRREIVEEELSKSKIKINYNKPGGAFYYFIDISSAGRTSAECARSLLNEMKVAVVPGSAYGSSGEGFIRISLAASEEEIRKGTRRIVEWLNKNLI